MLDAFKSLIANQFEAALCTLHLCIERCPESAWNSPVGNHRFCQVVFHTLFYADYYLGKNGADFRRQPFHRDNVEFFGDYEEFEDRAPQLLYARAATSSYLDHCRHKAVETIALETAETLTAHCGFERRTFSRAELLVYNMRHIQHHAAQLSLRLRIDKQVEVPWVGCGWRQT